MAKSFALIQTQTLTGTAASVEFTNIPQNYTDLLLVISARVTRAVSASVICLTFNSSGTGYSQRNLNGNGASASSISTSSTVNLTYMEVPAANATASTFGNHSIYIPNYAGSSYKSVSFDSVSENNGTTAYANLNAGVWANTSAISSLSLNEPNGNSNFVAGSSFTLYGIGGNRATGGTITSDGTYTYHTFTSTGTFQPLEQIKGAEVLVIAGGGGAAGGDGNGGAGAGGLLYAPGQTLIAGNVYTALVGAGGTAPAITTATKGADSVFSSLTANGGGASPPNAVGSNNTNGGSGAGCTYYSGYGGYLPGVGVTGQGYNGGNGALVASSYAAAGGGGGAGGAGANSSVTGSVANTGTITSGNGGIGASAYSSWGLATSTGQNVGGVYYYAGGGGGGTDYRVSGNTNGTGGYGGGGAGGAAGAAGTAGTANTGGGGGGGGYSGSFNKGGAGGSGLIIVRYPSM